MLVVCKYIVPSVTARVASEEECQGSSSPMSGAGRMLVTLTPRTVMPMAKDVLSTYLHIYISTYLQTGVFSIGFPAAHPTHESCHRLVAGVEQDADDLRPRGFLPVFPPYPCRYSYYHRHQTPGNTTVPAPKVGVIVTL